MAVFRIEKTRDYTVMSNYHLRDMSLSLKAKGLLSLMLSLPENWDYTMKGLARICKDGIDSISGGIRELEAHGYLIRARVRGANGQLGSIEYTILEQPIQHRDHGSEYPGLFFHGEEVRPGFCVEEGHFRRAYPLPGVLQGPGRRCDYSGLPGVFR